MDKEIRMFAKNTWTVLLVIASASLVACQGENTFRRQANPYGEYESLAQNGLPYDQNIRPVPKPSDEVPFTQTPACTDPFAMTVTDSNGKPLTRGQDKRYTLEFSENQEKSVTVKVESRLPEGRGWDIRPVDSPCGTECFTKVDKKNNQATYKFTWKPTKAARVQNPFLVLRYDFMLDSRCQPRADEVFNLSVKDGKSEPVVSFPGLQPQPIKFGESFQFTIKIDDPAATKDKAPDIESITFKKEGDSFNAKDAVDCKNKGMEVPGADGKTAWAFECSFESRRVKFSDAEMKSLAGSGKTVTASFAVKAQSNATKEFSDITNAFVQITFEKIVTATGGKTAQGDKK